MRALLLTALLLPLPAAARADGTTAEPPAAAPAAEPPAAEPPAACPDPAPPAFATEYDGKRAWIHDPGWFVPLDDPAIRPAQEASYRDETPFMTVELGGELRAYPIPAMAYHHVANDRIGGEAVVVTY